MVNHVIEQGQDQREIQPAYSGDGRELKRRTRIYQETEGKAPAWTELAPYFAGPRMDVGAYNTYDGDGRLAKRVDRRRNPAGGNTTWYEEEEYTIFSSVTGNAISELNDTGARTKLSVYMGGSVIAEHANTGFSFKHADPVTGATKQTNDDGLVNPNGIGRSNPEAFGANVTPEEDEITNNGFDYKKGGNLSSPETGCEIDGAPIDCRLLNSISRNLTIIDVQYRGGLFDTNISYSGRVFFHANPDKEGPDTPNEDPEVILAGGVQGGGRWEFTGTISYLTEGAKPRRKRKSRRKRAPAVDYVNLKTAISFCAQKMFGVELVGEVTWSPQKTSGIMTFQKMFGTVFWWSSDSLIPERISMFSIYNSSNTFTRKQMKAGVGSSAVGFTPNFNGIGIISGYTNDFPSHPNMLMSTNWNYTASDIGKATSTWAEKFNLTKDTGISRFIANQIHEAGNSLAEVTGIEYRNDIDGNSEGGDPDSGSAFQVCVLRNYKWLMRGYSLEETGYERNQ